MNALSPGRDQKKRTAISGGAFAFLKMPSSA